MQHPKKSNLQSELVELNQRVLSQLGEDTDHQLIELQGCTLHRSPVRTVLVYLTCIGTGTLVTMKWPLLGTIFLLLAMIGTYREQKGLRGFLGEFLTREVGMNLIFWRSSRLPPHDNWQAPPHPRLILLFPRSTPKRLKPFVLWLLITLALFMISLTWMNISILWGSLAMMLVGILGILMTEEKAPSKLDKDLEGPITQLMELPLENSAELVVGVIDQGILGGGVSAFFQSYRSFLSPQSSAVLLCLQKEGGSPLLQLGALWKTNPVFDLEGSFRQEEISSPLNQDIPIIEGLGWDVGIAQADWKDPELLSSLQNILASTTPYVEDEEPMGSDEKLIDEADKNSPQDQPTVASADQ